MNFICGAFNALWSAIMSKARAVNSADIAAIDIN